MRRLGVVFVLGLAGCSAERGETAAAEQSARTATVAEPLSNSEECDSAPADATITTFPGATTTIGPYGTRACAKAWLVDVTEPNVHARVEVLVSWSDLAVPSNPTDCANARLLAYSWQHDMGLNDLSSTGSWGNGRCQIPVIRMPVWHGGDAGAPITRRYAVSARQGNGIRSVTLDAIDLTNN